MDIFKVLTRGTNIKSNSINRDYTKTTKKSSLEEDKELDFFHNQTKKKSTDQVAEDELIDDEDISMKDLLVKNHFNGKLIYNIDNHLLNVDKPTEIQSKSIKIHTENEDVDIIGVSPTGTGKTLAFIIPLVSKIIANSNDTNMNSLQSIIIAPTNDLAKQIFQVTENIVQGIVLNHKANNKSNTKLDVQLLNSKLSNKLLFESEDANAKLPQILISTPKRLISVLNKENTESILEHVKYFVIDEFDQLFSSDFIKQTEKLLSLFDNKSDVSKWMYSATKPEDKVFNNIIKNHMNQPELIECKYSSKLTSNIVKPKITESLVFVGNEQGKLLQLRQLQQNAQFIPPMLIFLESHARCMALYNELKYNSIPMATLHSKMTINEREKVINDFKEGKVWVIITTDIMARGLDINGIRTVINYDIPKNKELYIHRLGRVGRGLTSYNSKRGNKKIECECITLYSKIDAKDVVPIAKVMRQHGAEGVPDWLVEGRVREEKKKGDKKDGNKLKREKISTVPGIIRKERRMKKEMIDASKKRKQEGIVRPPKKQKKTVNNA